MRSMATAAAAEEYRAFRAGAGVADLSSWTVLRLRGPDARSFLQGLATQDLDRDRGGAAYETLFLNEKGRPLALAWVFFEPAAAEFAWVLADEGARESLPDHFERFRVMEDVVWEVPEGTPRLYAVTGSHPLDPLAQDCKSAGGLTIPASPLSFALLPASLEAPRTVGAETFEAWRLAAGLPRSGIDYDSSRIATELSLPEAISTTKGCYVGQEVVARTSRGNVRRRRIGFRFAWPGNPIPAGAEIRAEGHPVGLVTSTVAEPGSTDGLGMGYLSTEIGDRAAHLQVLQGDATISLRVAPWPL